MRIYALIVFIIVGVYVGLKFYPSQVPSLSTTTPSISKTAKSSYTENLSCPNLYKDSTNQFSLCLPSNYQQLSPDSKIYDAIASFTPAQNSSCVAGNGSYCYVYFFSYSVGDTEVPPKRTEHGTITALNKSFQTEEGRTLNAYSPFSPSIQDEIYSYRLKNGKFAYFSFVTLHPKKEPKELNNHLKILKSVKDI